MPTNDELGEGCDTDAKDVFTVNAKALSAQAIRVAMGLLSRRVCSQRRAFRKTAKELNERLAKERQIAVESLQDTFEDPTQVKARISVDDVLCKKQKEFGREKGSPPPKKKERVKNTVAHIQNGKGETYTLTTATIAGMMIVLLAFLLSNGLLTLPGPVVFFTDGADDLLGAIQSMFSFLPFKLILDWYHLDVRRIGAC